LVESLVERLVADGSEVFVDEETKLSVEWARDLEQQIRTADAVVALLSPASVKDEMLAYGLEIVTQATKQNSGKPRLVPVLFDFKGPLPRQIELALATAKRWQWNGSQADEQLAGEIAGALQRLAT
jgi:hypothetical protein